MKLNGNYEEYKKKKADCEKSRRQRVKESLKKMTECKQKKFVENTRLRCLERVRKHRAKAKQLNPPQEKTSSGDDKLSQLNNSVLHQLQGVQSSYKTESAKAKATTKFRKGLPNSPSKQKAVIENFFNSLDDDTREEILFKKKKMNKGGKKGIGTELSEQIKQFYDRDDVSRMSPNTKDSRFYRNPTTGEKELKQKRYLILTLQQAYDKFLIENSGEKNLILINF